MLMGEAGAGKHAILEHTRLQYDRGMLSRMTFGLWCLGIGCVIRLYDVMGMCIRRKQSID